MLKLLISFIHTFISPGMEIFRTFPSYVSTAYKIIELTPGDEITLVTATPAGYAKDAVDPNPSVTVIELEPANVPTKPKYI